MKRQMVFLLAGLVLIASAQVSAGGRSEAARPGSVQDETVIGMVTLQMRSPYFVAMVRAVEEAAREVPNVRVIVADGDGDAAKVASDIEDLIAQGVDGFIMNISPLEALPGPMAAINDAGIPVVLVNRRLIGSEYNLFIGIDNFETGAAVGEVINQTMEGQGVLLMMRGGPEDNSTGNARRDGVLSKVQNTGVQIIFAPEFGGWTEDGGFRIMEDMLARHPRIDAVFAENDSMALGAMRAIQDSGRQGVRLFGFDGQRDALREIHAGGSYTASGLNSPTAIGRMGFDRLMAMMREGYVPAEREIYFPVTVVSSENVNQYFDPNSIF
ncbi:MAG: sugar ABC transporter substrate-binding protein [Spirochaetaceae bacterium]|nr:MAG: sugar ABC transporter substrate-binding protein [Spirochaetaceae bacterium]